MKIKKIFLLSLLILLLIGVSYATESNNDTLTTTDTPEVVKDTSTTTNIIDNSINEETKKDKEITKQANTNKTTKTASKTYDVTNFTTLHKALTTSKYDTVNLNINSNITLSGNTSLNEAIKTLTINGNGKTIDGQNKYQFLSFSYCNVTIKNIEIINCKSAYGAIYNNGILTIYNATFNNNNATGSNWNGDGGAIYNVGTLTINNSTFNNNRAVYSDNKISIGGAIYNSGTLTINNNIFNNNSAKNGGAIYSVGILTINNSTFNNNAADYDNKVGMGGAILSYGDLTINYSTFNNNNANNVGGAIYSSTKTVTINKCTLTNNTANSGGAIYNSYEGAYSGEDGTFIINNCTLTNNTANSGGAIYNYGSLKINNSILQYNTANQNGGAINQGGYVVPSLRITNTILQNNNANQNGGAIFFEGYLDIINCTLTNNTANQDGGAVYGMDSLDIINSILQYNTANQNGGAICNYCYQSIITNSTLQNNIANQNGGAIYNYCYQSIITNSTLQNNIANQNGGAIYNKEKMLVDNNLFITNKANTTGKIIIDMANATIENNTNDEIYRYSSTIYTNGTEVTIINNIFDDRKDVSIVTINKPDVKLNNSVTITGKLTDDIGKTLSNTTVDIKINNESVNVKTNSEGVYEYATKTTIAGLNNITVTFEGDQNYLGSSNNTTFLGKQPTCINIASTSNVKYGTTVKLVGRLLYNDTNAVKYVPVNVTVNAKVYNLKTDGAGYIRVNHTIDTYDDQKVTFKFAGNNIYASSSNSTMFKVKQPTCIKIANMTNVKYGSTVKLVGRLLYNDTNAVKYVPVNVTVNDKVYNLKTDGAGYIRVNHTIDSYDNQEVTFKFAGNSLYLASSNTTTFKVKQPTWIKIAYMSNVEYGSTVKVLGRLLNGNTAVKYKFVNVTVNNKVYKVKTDGAGYIRLNYTANNYNDQKITFKFAGNSLYLASSNNTTFKVKQPTWIKHASIGKVKQGSTVKIVGRLLYNGTNSVKYVPVNVTVNGEVYKLKTDGAGYYRLNYTATTLGTVTFTSNFGGNKLYLASTNSTKFTVVKS